MGYFYRNFKILLRQEIDVLLCYRSVFNLYRPVRIFSQKAYSLYSTVLVDLLVVPCTGPAHVNSERFLGNEVVQPRR